VNLVTQKTGAEDGWFMLFGLGGRLGRGGDEVERANPKDVIFVLDT